MNLESYGKKFYPDLSEKKLKEKIIENELERVSVIEKINQMRVELINTGVSPDSQRTKLIPYFEKNNYAYPPGPEVIQLSFLGNKKKESNLELVEVNEKYKKQNLDGEKKKMKYEIVLDFLENLESELVENYAQFAYYGLRFDSRKLKIGSICDPSRSNIDRDDIREFPLYDTEEYNSLPLLSGTSAYFIFDGEREKRNSNLNEILSWVDDDFNERFWYILGSEKIAADEAEDEDEIIMIDAIVLERIDK